MDEIIEKSEEKELRTTYLAEIDKIEISQQEPGKKIELLDILIRDYLRKKYHIKKDDDYSDLIPLFLEKNKPTIAILCHEMTKQLYSGEPMNDGSVVTILEETKDMIEKESSETKNYNPAQKGLLSKLMSNFKKRKHPSLQI